MSSPGPRKPIEIWFGEPLPPVCIVCGSHAGNSRLVLFDKQLTFVESFLATAAHALAVLANAVLVPRIKSKQEIANILNLPLCDEHLQTGRLRERLGIIAGRSGSVLVSSFAAQFSSALDDARSTRAAQLSAQLTHRIETESFLKSLASEPPGEGENSAHERGPE